MIRGLLRSALFLPLLIALCGTAAADVLPFTGWAVSMPARTIDGGTEEIAATILKPAGDGPFPAVVMMHDCSGLGPRSSGAPRRWGDLLAAQGYVILIPDSFSSRGFPEGVCTVALDTPRDRLRRVAPYARAFDAYAALAWLRTQPFVDGAHVGVMGGSHGGSTTLASMAAPASPSGWLIEEKQHGFAAAVALYPGCGDQYGAWIPKREFGTYGPVTTYGGVYRPIAPLLILVGEKDDWTPARDCDALASGSRAAGFPVDIKIYPGAYHSFDSDRPVRYIASRRNANKPDRQGATTGGNREAWNDAIEQVKAFFAKQLKGRPQ